MLVCLTHVWHHKITLADRDERWDASGIAFGQSALWISMLLTNCPKLITSSRQTNPSGGNPKREREMVKLPPVKLQLKERRSHSGLGFFRQWEIQHEKNFHCCFDFSSFRFKETHKNPDVWLSVRGDGSTINKWVNFIFTCHSLSQPHLFHQSCTDNVHGSGAKCCRTFCNHEWRRELVLVYSTHVVK